MANDVDPVEIHQYHWTTIEPRECWAWHLHDANTGDPIDSRSETFLTENECKMSVAAAFPSTPVKYLDERPF